METAMRRDLAALALAVASASAENPPEGKAGAAAKS